MSYDAYRVGELHKQFCEIVQPAFVCSTITDVVHEAVASTLLCRSTGCLQVAACTQRALSDYYNQLG
jgi:hypothetical protein